MSEILNLLKNHQHDQSYFENLDKYPAAPGPAAKPFNEFAHPLGGMVVNHETARYGYSNQFGPFDREYWWIPVDHCYARPWNWRPESTFLRPTKTLFMQKGAKKRPPTDGDAVDVETPPEEQLCVYDKARARVLMEECEEHVSLARVDNSDEDWEEKVNKHQWTPTQNRLFNGMAAILTAEHLARLAHHRHANEPVARRLAVDRSVVRVRRLLASVAWDPKWTQWLHQLLVDHLTPPHLAAYLDILQTLKAKLGAFVDKMIAAANNARLSVFGFDALFPLLRRPWDPVAGSLVQDKPKKLPGSPIIVFVPSTPISSKRMLKWINLLSSLTTIVTIPSNYAGSAGHKLPMTSCVDQMFVMTRNKMQDIRLDYPGRNIVLLGFGFGATLALQVAQVEQVLCVISVGFGLVTAEGRRGEMDDNLLELQCPVLFIVGQCAATSLQEEMEDLRERMRVETGLIVVGAADDQLRVDKRKKLSEGITQSIVDRCIAEEIGEFISGVILSPYPPQIRQSPTNLSVEATKKGKAERKRYNSNASSVDSEPPSPTPRITRPGHNHSLNFGRPPGSKSKQKLEARWAATQGILPSSDSPASITTPDTNSSSNDSSTIERGGTSSNLIESVPSTSQSVKKLKTLKPISTSLGGQLGDKSNSKTNHTTPSTSAGAAKNLNLQNRSLSSLLQGDFQGKKLNTSGIKVLENVKLTSGGINKKFSSKMIDMSKMSVINPKSASGNSIMFLPDGRLKNIPQGGKYITSKRQLLGTKPPKPVKKIQYLPQAPQLPPPRNLTTQDILDLPIIFADDNQVLDTTTFLQHAEPKPAPAHPKIITATPGSKFVLINKQQQLQHPSFLIPHTKAPPAAPSKTVAPKYTKIILSSKKIGEGEKPAGASTLLAKLPNLSNEISVRKVVQPKLRDDFDLENEIVASTLFKPQKVDEEEEGDGLSPEDMMENLFKRAAEDVELEEPESKFIRLS